LSGQVAVTLRFGQWRGRLVRRRRPRTAAPLISCRYGLLAGLLAAAPAGAQTTFSDQTTAAGIAVSLDPADDAPEVETWGGACIGDFNDDGWPDIFLAGGGDTTDKLFLNQQDGTFTDAAADWALTDLYRGNGCAVGDYDNDGDQDLFVNSAGDLPSSEPTDGQQRLYRNDGGVFTEVGAAAGVTYAVSSSVAFYPMGAAFGDYDLDGDLDLHVNTWVNARDANNDPATTDGNRLFRNNGDGTFTDVTAAAGVWDINIHGFASRFVDMNGDRYPELLIAADFHSTRYGINNQNGSFTLIGCELPPNDGNCDGGIPDNTVIGHDRNGMGHTVADFDGDGDFDWYVTSIWQPPSGPPRVNNGNMMYTNQGNHVFTQEDGNPEASEYDLGATDGGWGWGTVGIDFDHDGDVDIVATNGWSHNMNHDDEPTYVFLNNRIGTGSYDFTEVHEAVDLINLLDGRALDAFDYDRDGDLDLLLTTRSDCDTVGCAAPSPIFLYRNELIPAAGVARGTPATNWLEVVLDTRGNPALAPDGLGAVVQITIGSTVQRAPLCGGNNFQGQSELLVHFGVAGATMIDELKVEWPDGNDTVLAGVAVNQRLIVAAPINYLVTGAAEGALSQTRRYAVE
jgi:hypothetical protein